MDYRVAKTDDGFIVKMVWRDGSEHEYGPFPSAEYAMGFANGFMSGIDCHN